MNNLNFEQFQHNFENTVKISKQVWRQISKQYCEELEIPNLKLIVHKVLNSKSSMLMTDLKIHRIKEGDWTKIVSNGIVNIHFSLISAICSLPDDLQRSILKFFIAHEIRHQWQITYKNHKMIVDFNENEQKQKMLSTSLENDNIDFMQTMKTLEDFNIYHSTTWSEKDANCYAFTKVSSEIAEMSIILQGNRNSQTIERFNYLVEKSKNDNVEYDKSRHDLISNRYFENAFENGTLLEHIKTRHPNSNFEKLDMVFSDYKVLREIGSVLIILYNLNDSNNKDSPPLGEMFKLHYQLREYFNKIEFYDDDLEVFKQVYMENTNNLPPILKFTTLDEIRSDYNPLHVRDIIREIINIKDEMENNLKR